MNDNKKHIVLLGDSIFDNLAYVRHSGIGKDKDVIRHVKDKIQMMNLSYDTTLLAVDGNVISHVHKVQMNKIPENATHLFISVGGNDALGAIHLLHQKVNTVGEAFLTVSTTLGERFQKEYREMLDAIQKSVPHAHLTVCFIYNPRYDDQKTMVMVKLGISALNDIILQEAVKRKLPVIDLRSMFNEYEDYANSIEPSSQGGEKISRAILDIVQNHDFDHPRTVIYN